MADANGDDTTIGGTDDASGSSEAQDAVDSNTSPAFSAVDDASVPDDSSTAPSDQPSSPSTLNFASIMQGASKAADTLEKTPGVPESIRSAIASSPLATNPTVNARQETTSTLIKATTRTKNYKPLPRSQPHVGAIRDPRTLGGLFVTRN